MACGPAGALPRNYAGLSITFQCSIAVWKINPGRCQAFKVAPFTVQFFLSIRKRAIICNVSAREPKPFNAAQAEVRSSAARLRDCSSPNSAG